MENQIRQKPFEVTRDITATSGQRILNYLIDVAIIYIIVFSLTIVIGLITVFMGSYAFVNWTQNVSTLESYLIFFCVMFPYYTLFETLKSRTVAKYITKTMVVMEDGSKPSAEIIMKRTLCRLIPFDGFSYLGHSVRGWHDTIPDVYVVKKRNLKEKKKCIIRLTKSENLKKICK